VAIAGLLNVPLATMLVFGTLIGLPTAILTTFLYGRLLRYGLWNKARDEADVEETQGGIPLEVGEGQEESPAETERQDGDGYPLCTFPCCPFSSRSSS
jgi:GntP family gluconate:H+ symporter